LADPLSHARTTNDGTVKTDTPDVLIRDAGLLVTMAGEELPGGWVALHDGVVAAVGRPGEEPEATEVVSVPGCLVTPGLVNAHHHMFQNLTRSFAPVINSDWLVWREMIGPTWIRLDEEAAFVSTWIALAELALGGCTCSMDHLFAHPRPNLIDAEIAAAADIGMRFHPVRGGMDMQDEGSGYREPELFQTADQILSDCERLVSAYHDPSPTSMIRIGIGPVSMMDATAELMTGAVELAERTDIRMHTHLCQTPPEEPFCLEHYGHRPVDHFEQLGWGRDRAWVAHSIFVNDDEVHRLARWGTGVAHCPSANMMICIGVAPVRDMRRAGIQVGLGCDGSAATDHGSMWLEARTALLLGRLREGATSMTSRDALEIATTGSAGCLGRSGEIGQLTPGACGDVVVWPMEGIQFAGAWTDPVEALLRCGPTAAKHTIVDGRFVVRDGRLTSPRVNEMLQLHEKIARSWQGVAVAG
jgi:cytosine/adenosine deaminase-related metal-dependent hydrolase